MKVLVTGSAGFIGSAVTLRLLERGDEVIGIDNHNKYYDPALKEARLARHSNNPNYTHYRVDIADRSAVEQVFEELKPQGVINLAAQAGVRYSIENPLAYVESNIVGFAHILEACRHNAIEHLVYASSSSIYGANNIMPFSEDVNADHPLSLYAASKKANELMAHSYSHLYTLSTTGLRIFTVYGPWGRPDMALFKFTKAILEGKPLQVFNHGRHLRDFTYIDDVVEIIINVLNKPPVSSELPLAKNSNYPPHLSSAPWRIYNIGSNNPVNLMDYIKALEKALGKTAVKEYLPLQPGDVKATYADSNNLVKQFLYEPSTTVEEGITKFIRWYQDYHKQLSNNL